MATAADTFDWDGTKAALKAYLAISGDAEDTWLEPWLAAAAKDCDDFCGWYYLDFDDERVDATPDNPAADPLILLGIYEWVRAYRAAFHGIPTGVKAARTGAISVTFGGGANGATAAKIAKVVAHEIWETSIYNPLNAGKG